MRIGITRTIQLLTALLLVAPATTQAGIPDGTLVFQFPAGAEIYDFDQFDACETLSEIGYVITACLEVDMTPDGKGKYAGSATLTFEGDLAGTLTGPASGSVKGKGPATKEGQPDNGGTAQLKLGLEGDITALGITLPSAVKTSCKGPVYPDGFLVARCKVTVKIIGAGSASVLAFFEDQLVGGLWTITLDVMPLDEKKFEGTGTDSLGFEYAVKGKYNAKKDLSNIKATGDKETSSKGAKVQLKNLTPTGEADASYAVQGYKGKTPVETD